MLRSRSQDLLNDNTLWLISIYELEPKGGGKEATISTAVNGRSRVLLALRVRCSDLLKDLRLSKWTNIDGLDHCITHLQPQVLGEGIRNGSASS